MWSSDTSLKERLFQVCVFHRREFFKLWNQIHHSEWILHSWEEKLEAIFSLWSPEPRRYRLPPDIRFVCPLDDDYPAVFFELPQPPLGVFVQGNWEPAQSAVAVVGSRKPTSYALRMCRKMVQSWAEEQKVIVSGGALGIDAEAHRSALDFGAETWVILGGGHHQLYPATHRSLFFEILRKGGALISEYPPFQKAFAYQFPERNRLIAALGEALFIAQAHAKSGSLHTARTAMDLGREIYVLRPLAGDENFSGNQELIESGALCLNQPTDRHRTLLGSELEKYRSE